MARSVEELLQDMLDRMDRGGGGSLRSGSGRDDGPVDYKKIAEDAKKAGNGFAQLHAGMRISLRSQSEYRQAQNDVRRALGEVEEALYKYKKGTLALSADERKKLESERKRLLSMEQSDNATQKFQSGVQQVFGALQNYGSQMIAGQAAVAAAIQGGGSGFAIAGAQIESSLQLANSATQMFAGGVSTAGAALMGFGGIVGKLAGGAMFVYAEHLKMQSNLETQAASARNRILMQGADQLLKSYQTATASGAVLSNGLGGMLKSLEGSRYTIDDYSEIVKNNQEALSRSNLGIGEASLMIGKVGKVLKDQKIDRQLLGLGYSLQEQAALSIEVIANMRKTDPMKALDAQEVAKRTKEYATDLKVLQEITGKNARAEMEKNRGFTSELAFQNFLQTLGPNAEAVSTAMASLPDAVKLNVKEILTLGDVQNKTGAIMTANNAGLAAMQQELASAARRGAGQKEFEAIMQKYSKSVNDGFLANKDLNLALSLQNSKYKDLGDTSAKVREEINKYANAEKTRAEIEAARNKGGTPQEDPKTALLNDVVILGQDIKKAFQDHIISNLEAVGPALKKVLADIEKGFPMPKAPTTQEMLNDLKSRFLKFWEGLEGYEKVMVGVAGALLAFSALKTVLSPIVDAFRLIGSLFGKTPQPPTTLPSGATWDERSGRYRNPQTGRYERGPGGNLPSSPGGRAGQVPNIPGQTTAGLGRFGDFIANTLKALGQGAGGLIQGLMSGIAAGIGAFANPKILLGAGILSGAIVLIGAGIAGASWLMGKALPTLADGLKQVQEVDGDKLVAAAKGVAAIGAAMAVFGAGSVLGTVASGLSQLGESVIKFFGGKSQTEQWAEMAKLGPQLAEGAKGIGQFASAMKELLALDIAKIDSMSKSLEKMKDATSGPGFFSSLGNAILGAMPAGFREKMAQGQSLNQGGVTGVGQTVYMSGMAVVKIDYPTLNYLISGIKGTGAVITTPATVPNRTAGATNTLPQPRTGQGLTLANITEMAKTDPTLFALAQMIEQNKNIDRNNATQNTKLDSAITELKAMKFELMSLAGHGENTARNTRQSARQGQ